ncbi:MAG TPA: DUF2071 domain-containing protein [Acidimicrobiia bacterium]|jgi:uncharacterized protein YqjF (DUF2071 family)
MHEYPIEAFERLRHTSLIQQWQRLTFVHWRYDPTVVQEILPDGLTVDTFDGSAWVGLVPFHMMDVRPPFIPTLHPLTTFPETNIRTYVRGSRGQGVWFCSLEITRLLGVVAARTLFGVPYTWAEMSIDQTSERIRYTSRRRWPKPRGASSTLEIEIGERRAELTGLERFLTSRWATYSKLPGGGLGWVPVEHEPWQLHSARIRELGESLTIAAGLPAPTSHAVAHYSPGVTARIGFPHRA